jgi:protein-L-isoaspartate(D-aspartate) O-methyltransferase
MDLEKARFNMVEQQVRTWDVLDQAVLDLMVTLPRDAFVPDAYRNLAYADINVALEDGQVMMAPKVEGRLVQALQIEPHDAALEIGTGSGFVTALLAHRARHVTSIEISPVLHEQAKARLAGRGVGNVSLELGDGIGGWEATAPYDAIAVTGSVASLDECFQRQLRVGGRLFVIVGAAPAMEALLITRTGRDQWSSESLFETVLPPLRGAEPARRFVL